MHEKWKQLKAMLYMDPPSVTSGLHYFSTPLVGGQSVSPMTKTFKYF